MPCVSLENRDDTDSWILGQSHPNDAGHRHVELDIIVVRRTAILAIAKKIDRVAKQIDASR